MAVAALEPVTHRHPHGKGCPLSKGPGGHVNAHCFIPVTVAGEIGARLVEGQDILIRKIAKQTQGAINGRACMTF